MFIIQSVHLFERARPTAEGDSHSLQNATSIRPLAIPRQIHPLYPVVPYDRQLTNGMPDRAPGSTTLNTVCAANTMSFHYQLLPFAAVFEGQGIDVKSRLRRG